MGCVSANSFFSGDFYKPLPTRDFLSGTTSTTSDHRIDPAGVGFLDGVGGSLTGFVSCTETLGFESFDERTTVVSSSIEHSDVRCNENRRQFESVDPLKRLRERSAEKRKELNFPPPLASLNRYGWPSFVLRPVRKDGRLEIKEIQIYRPEILRASRANGRLSIHLVKTVDQDDDDDDDEDETEEAGSEEVVEDFEFEDQENESEIEIETDAHETRLAVTVSGDGGGEGPRRCFHRYEETAHDQICHMDVWSPSCVPTR